MIAKLQEEETKEAAKREAIQFEVQTTMSNLAHFFYMGKKRIIKCVHRDKIQAELNLLKQKAAAGRDELLREESAGRDELLRGESDDWCAMQAELSALCTKEANRQERLDAMNAAMGDDLREVELFESFVIPNEEDIAYLTLERQLGGLADSGRDHGVN